MLNHQETPSIHSVTSNSLQLPNLPFNQSIKVANPKEIALPTLCIRPTTPFDPLNIDNEDRHLYTKVQETPRTMAGKIKKIIDTSYEGEPRESSEMSEYSQKVAISLVKKIPKVAVI
jgi:hypothetical protein